MTSSGHAEVPECPVCLEQYNHTNTIPLVLPCGHSTCATCLRRLHNLSTTTTTTTSPPNTLHCPSCTQLIPFTSPSSLPKNIDLLRFSQPPTPIPTPPNNPTRLRPAFRHEMYSDQLYKSWKDWVLPQDTILRDDQKDDHLVGVVRMGCEIMGFCLIDGQRVGLVEIGRFQLSVDHIMVYSYVSKVMSVLNCMSDDQISGLKSVLRVSVKVSRVSRVLGLWLDVENGCVYLVSQRMNVGLLGLIVTSQDCRNFLGTVGVELCEILISLHREGFVCGCLGMSCVSFDEFGRVHVDLSEVLLKGRKANECVVNGKLELNNSEGEDFVVNMCKMDVFVSPQVMLEVLCREGIEVDKNDLSCATCYDSDTWLLACVLLRVIIGIEFGEVICNYLKAILEGTSDRVSKCNTMYTKCVDMVNKSLETIMGNDSAMLQEIFVKCLDYAPEPRPSLIDVWKSLKTLNYYHSMNNVASFDMAPTRKEFCQSLALNELCNISSSIRNESNAPLIKERDGGEVGFSEATEAKLDDVIEGLVAGKLQCKDLVGHLDCITGFCVGGGFLFSSSFDKTVNVWSLQDFTHVHTFRGHEHRVMAVVFVDQEKPLCISADNGGGIFLWEVTQPFGLSPLKKWYEEKDWRYSGIHALAFSESGYLYTGSGDRLIKAWSSRDYTLLCSMEGHKSVVSSLALSNGVLYSGSWDGTVRLWCLHDHSPMAVFSEDTPGIVSSVHCLYAEQNMVIAAYENGHLKIWVNDVLKTSKHLHNGAALTLAMEENRLFSGGWDRTVKVQKIETDGAKTDILDIGSVACDSVVTALMYVEGVLYVGYGNKLIKVFHCRS